MKLPILCSLLAVLMACNVDVPAQAAEPSEQQPAVLKFTATVHYINLEGGFYALHSQDGQRFLPMGLPKSLQQDGLQVQVEGQIRTDVITIQQYGQVLQVLNAKKVSQP